MLKVDVLAIDPQIDFCDPAGSLFVPGADKDCERLAKMIRRISPKINDIHVTLDTHHRYDIAHPMFWLDSAGKHPDPFTIITPEDVKKGKWRTTIPAHQNHASMKAHGLDRDGAEEYVQSLATNGRYPLCIWPPHCLIGSRGYDVQPDVFAAISEWEESCNGFVDFVTKGSNFFTEHYSAVQADVPDPEDNSTQLNTRLIETLQKVDIIAISGQALSHCVRHTVVDIANNFGEENIKKFVLIEDTSSSVPGFENFGIDFVKDMTARGMQVSKAAEFLK